MRYHPPFAGLPAAIEIDASELSDLIKDERFSQINRDIFSNLLLDATEKSQKSNMPLHRYLYIFKSNGKIEKWID